AELEPCGGLDAEMHAERGLRRGIAARLARCAPESSHEARRARDTRHVGRGRADILGGHVAPAERVDESAKASNVSGVFCLRGSPMMTALPPPKGSPAIAFL